MFIRLIIWNQLLITSTVYIMQEDQDLIQMIMSPTIQIQYVITSIAFTTEEVLDLIQMTIRLIIWNQLLTTNTICIMQETQDLIPMIMNPTIEYLGDVYKDFEIQSIYLHVSPFVSPSKSF